MEFKPIYMDQESVNELTKEIKKLEGEYYKRTSFNGDDTTDRYNLSLEEANKEKIQILDLMKIKLAELSRVQIIEPHGDKTLVDIGDVVEVIFTEDGTANVFKLVARDGNFDKETPEISINSPLGSAIYKRNIGEICTYEVNDHYGFNTNLISVLISRKLNLEEEMEKQTR